MNTDVAVLDPWDAALAEYVTDGRRLLRVVSEPDRRRGLKTAVLEDCRTLELVVCPVRKLRRLRALRGVRRAARAAR